MSETSQRLSGLTERAPDTTTASRSPTLAALVACAEWLRFCLEIGWRREDLDFLETLWWQGHDHRGNLKRMKPSEDA